ncbi:GAP family protein [Actinomadura macrotermitis]|uniref:Sap, sulfolipid-1-addressing protein n=1 Tax=Actinomadura macrotermitis TaxID=2585200 RepID=A0A7K0BUH1_9ACTN|nr:hypothetical protein [Actinomadura macrotermitis]
MNLQILPLAITMMVGPQIMSAVILVTTERAISVSLAFVAGVAAATATGVAVAWGAFALLDRNVSLGAPSDRGALGTLIQYGLVALLIMTAVKTYLRRETAEPPKWLGSLMEAEPRKALMTGFLVILLMPSDILVMLTVGANLEQHHAHWTAALPFVAATALIASLPLLAFLLLRRRMERAMPALRTWVNGNSWVISIAACVIFILLIL